MMECTSNAQLLWMATGGCVTLVGVAFCFIIGWFISNQQTNRETKRFMADLDLSRYTGGRGVVIKP